MSELDTSHHSEILAWQRQLLRGILLALVVVAVPAGIGASYDIYLSGLMWELFIAPAAYGLLLFVTFYRRIPYIVQVSVLLGLLYMMGLVNLIMTAQIGNALPFMMVVPFLAVLLFYRRRGMITLGIVLLTVAVFGWLYVSGRLAPLEELPTSDDLGSWLTSGLVFAMLALLLVLPSNYLLQRLATALGESRAQSEILESRRADLEKQVAERVRDLDRRSGYLEATAIVAQGASLVLDDPEAVLASAVSSISEQFGFYHVAVFLLDETGEWAEMKAASSEGGRRLLDRGHRLYVGQQGIVGYVAGQGYARIALDVGEDAVFFQNPDLPDTRSEIGLPLRAAGQTIGVLDVQSTEEAAFSDEDVSVLQILADQVAVTVHNARLLRQVRESETALRRAYGEMDLVVWRELLRTQSLNQRYDPRHILPAEGELGAEASLAITKGQVVAGENGASTVLAIPIRTRGGQVIGVVDARKPEGTGEWMAEEQSLLTALVEQLGVALDSAQLYQESQRRAEQERQVGAISARMRETLDVDAVLQTAIREMSQLLNIAEVQVHMRGQEEASERPVEDRPVDRDAGPGKEHGR